MPCAHAPVAESSVWTILCAASHSPFSYNSIALCNVFMHLTVAASETNFHGRYDALRRRERDRSIQQQPMKMSPIKPAIPA